MQDSSDFLIPEAMDNSHKAWKNPFAEGATSICYKEFNSGRLFVRKSLKKEFLTSARHRNIFKKEYSIGKSFDCPYIVNYQEFVDNETECSILMDYVEGPTLKELLEEKPDYFASKKLLTSFLLQVLSALKYMHQRQVLHLDLKPENIIITSKSSDVKIIDLGFCYSDSFQFTAGATASYAASEQLDGSLDYDVRTDIHGFGKILEFINNHHPLPKPYQKIIQRCLEDKKEERFQNVTELSEALLHRNKSRKIIFGLSCIVVLLVIGFLMNGGTRKVHRLIYGYDFQFENLNFRIVSDDSLTCEIVSFNPHYKEYIQDMCIRTPMSYDDKSYKVIAVADTAFIGEELIGSVSILSPEIKLGNGIFGHCKNLKSVSIPDNIKDMGFSILNNCENLTSVRFPEGVPVVPQGFFHHSGIKNIVLPEGVTTIMQDAFCDCNNLTEVKLPSTLTTIGRGTFYKCDKLTEITIPASVSSIGVYCFDECKSLKTVYNYSPKPQNIVDIFDQDAKITVFVPQEAVELYKNSICWKTQNIQPIADGQ